MTWCVHPRYMRCDARALTGPMNTPELVIDGDLVSPVTTH